jgi:ElaB/YqjD/DUF883 family membrane-anchored ribosome-binding protein
MAQCEWVDDGGKRCGLTAATGDFFCPTHKYRPNSTVGTVAHPGTGAEAGAATGTASQAQEYSQKINEAASMARDYISEKTGAVGEKLQELRNKDYSQMADDAKQYARQNPGQALLISAAAGFLLGILLRGNRR